MYCPTCGDQSTQGLKFCKRCGASLAAQVETNSRSFPTSLTAMFLAVIGLVTIIGLKAPLGATESLSRIFGARDIMIILFGSWILTVLVDVMLVWLLFMLTGLSQQFTGTVQKKGVLPEHPILAQLDAPPEPMMSVTENTTRSFHPRVHDRLKT